CAGQRARERAQWGDRPRRRVLGRLPRTGLQCRAAGQEDGPASRAVEPLTQQVHLATTDCGDPAELAAVAARTFPLACPPTMAPENIASFIDANLSATRFEEYLADPRYAVLAAVQDGRIIGYAMLVRGVDDDSAELSKMYLLPDFHGTG